MPAWASQCACASGSRVTTGVTMPRRRSVGGTPDVYPRATAGSGTPAHGRAGCVDRILDLEPGQDAGAGPAGAPTRRHRVDNRLRGRTEPKPRGDAVGMRRIVRALGRFHGRPAVGN